MMNEYEFNLAPQFARKYKKLTKNNTLLKRKIRKAIVQLARDPFHQSLRTHKVNNHYSSSATGDIRVIWNFDGESVNIINLLNLGGHSGGNNVYK